MRTELYRIDGNWTGRLAISPRPRGGDWLGDEVAAWDRAGVQVVVSLLSADESAELGLADEPAECRGRGLEFISFPVTDRGVPESWDAFRGLVAELTADLSAGRSVLVHCRQAIGRAGLVAIGVLLSAGVPPEAAIERVGRARGREVPETAEQRRWIEEQAKIPFTQAA